MLKVWILTRVSFVRCFTCDTETVNRTPSGFISFYSLSCISICVARFTQRIDLGFFGAIPKAYAGIEPAANA